MTFEELPAEGTVVRAPDGRCWRVGRRGKNYRRDEMLHVNASGPEGPWVEILHVQWMAVKNGYWGPEAGTSVGQKTVAPGWLTQCVIIAKLESTVATY